MFEKCITSIRSFFALIFGRLSWMSPPWMMRLKQGMAARPRLAAGIITALLALLLMGVYGYHWYKNLPRPHQITARITPPHITPLAKTLVPDVLTVDFGIDQNGFTSRSVVPLKNIGKDITHDIVMKPAIPGTWVWQTDSRLIFTPTEDWPAGQLYSIRFAKNSFASHIKMESLNYTFSTLPFAASISNFRLYQDPVNPKIRQAVATITFNYPVDTKSLENHTSLVLQSLKKSGLHLMDDHFKLTFAYDENKREAYIHSDSLPLPETTRYLELTVDKGVRALTGSATIDNPLTQTVMIPDAASYFTISGTNASIVRNDEGRPEQIITLETTLGVTNGELEKGLHVYLLPQDYPATAVEPVKPNYSFANPGEVTDAILKLSSPVTLQPVPTDRDYASLHSYRITAPAGRFIYIKLDKGIKGFGDFSLANNYVAIVRVPDYPKEIGFLHKGALLALNSEKKLSVLVRGLPAVKFKIARVLPENVNQLITQTEGDFNNPRFINQSFNENNISELFSTIQSFSGDPAKADYTALDIGRYLSAKTNTGGPQGLFLLQATGWDVQKNVSLDVKATRLILVTDLGLLVKDNSDGSHDVFVESITEGKPVAMATVSILGKNGLAVLSRVTDAEGRAHFPTLKDFTDEREPTVYLASLGQDVSFIPYNHFDRELNFSRFDTGGVYNDPELQTLSAYVFSDRGIYKPGDTAHIGMIIKQAFAAPQPAGLPLEATVTDPRGTTIRDQKFLLDATGYLAMDVPTTTTSPTGQYTVNLFIVKDNHPGNFLGSTTLRVADFQPDRMKITSRLSSDATTGWISPDKLSANITLTNLYGAPATDRKVTATLLLAPQRIQFASYPDYTFVDPLFDPNKPPKTFSDTLPDAKTNEKGEAQFDLNLERFDKATYEMTVSTEGFESEGGRSVAAESKALVSPLAYFIGYKADGDLSYIRQNSQRSVNIIAVNPQLKKQSVEGLKIQLAELHPVSTLVKNADGTFQYQSLIQTHLMDTKPFSVSASGTSYTLPTDRIGEFVVTILDQNNTELSRFKYVVTGTAQLSMAKNAELTIRLNKSEYQPDEEIELQITAPYTGSGLITIERDKVYATQWFKTNTTGSIQKIRIPKDFQGNGYVNVAFIRDWDSPEIFINPLSDSVAPFHISHTNQTMNIDLTIPAEATPGEPFTVSYKSDKSGKIIVFAVDEGILQVADYKTPDPSGFFFQKHALEVITQQTIDQILPKFIEAREMSAVGGDNGGAAALRSHLNPFKRKTDLPVAYWSGIVDTDNTPRQLTWMLPDYFNGTLRVMAVAAAVDAVGSTDKKSEIRGPFVINPNVPTFVAPHDEFEITASIANNIKNSGKNAKVEVMLSASPQLEIVNDAKQTLAIDENHEKTVHFVIRAKNQLGAAQLTFVTRLGNQSGKMNATLSVRPVNDYVTTVISGTSDEAEKSLTLNRVLYPEYRTVTAALSESPLILLTGLKQYLDNFPYGCTEQLVSKAFPLVAANTLPGIMGDPKLATQKIDATIQMLGQRQLSSGGFSYWPTVGDNTNNAFDSVYAMHFLTEAREHGFTVPTDMMQSGIQYLKSLAEQNATDLNTARIKAYAIYILTRNEIITSNYLTNLQVYLDQDKNQVWRSDITSAYIAASYQMMKGSEEANRLIHYYKLQKNAENTVDFYSGDIADAEYLYLLAKHFPDELQKSGKELIAPLTFAVNTEAINTLLASYTSLALSAYSPAIQTTTRPSLSVSETLLNHDKKILPSLDASYTKVNIDDLAKTITFSNPSKQSYFYQLTQSGYDQEILTSAVSNHLEVEREYRNSQGKVITEATLGSEMEVHIQIRTLDNSTIENVAITDLLPGGFEVVNDSVHADTMDYADLREDRVIFFGSVTPSVQEIVYRIKATNTGKYTVPPIFANSMYNPSVNAHGVAGKMEVTG
ncbi:MAG TPA: alpha-2-macroglobulin [Gammaproteobacteria bacterium]|nr:alpha-2-macroglobulin [Gammaproteobacteria bacterium]